MKFQIVLRHPIQDPRRRWKKIGVHSASLVRVPEVHDPNYFFDPENGYGIATFGTQALVDSALQLQKDGWAIDSLAVTDTHLNPLETEENLRVTQLLLAGEDSDFGRMSSYCVIAMRASHGEFGEFAVGRKGVIAARDEVSARRALAPVWMISGRARAYPRIR